MVLTVIFHQTSHFFIKGEREIRFLLEDDCELNPENTVLVQG